MLSKKCLFDNNSRKAQQHYNRNGASCANSHDRIDVFGKLNINKLGENREQNSLPKLRETGDIKCSPCHHSINEYNFHLWLAQTEILVSTPSSASPAIGTCIHYCIQRDSLRDIEEVKTVANSIPV